MTDNEKNELLKAEILKKLDDIGGTQDLLQESDVAFKIKGFRRCIMKYPYNKKAITMREHDNSDATPKNLVG